MGKSFAIGRGSVFLLGSLACGCVPHAQLEVAPTLQSTEWSSTAAAPAAAPNGAPVAQPANLGAALGSAELERLISQAVAANTDVGIAQARIRQARALFRSARGAMLPVVNASAGLSGTQTQRTGDPFNFSEAFAGLDISFDLDLFGAGRAERRAARER